MKKIIFIIALFISNLNVFAQIAFDTTAYIRNNRQLYAVLVSKDGEIIHEQYFNGQDGNTLFNDQSLTKSITALLIGIAIDKGYIKSVDQKLVDFFPELEADADKRKQDITIRQIMNQASGLYHEGVYVAGLLKIPNPSDYVLHAPMVSEPGNVFRYNNAATHLLSVILTKSTGMETHLFAQKYLFAPLGITSFEWKKMLDGYDDGCGLLSLRLRSSDMLKIGNMVLNNGVFNDQQVVPAQWISSIITPEKTYKTEWGLNQSLYGLCWYHADYEGHKIIYGQGWGGQFIFLIPSLNVVITINSDVTDKTAIKETILITTKLFPQLFRQLKN